MSANRDRYGEVIELPVADIEAARHHDCDGWTGEDVEGRPIPCSRCKGPTVQRIKAQRRRDYLGPLS